MKTTVLVGVAAALLASGPARAQVVLTVPGSANIFGAGHPSPPAPGGGGAGVLPPVYNFGATAGTGGVLTFSNVTGTVTLNVGTGDTPNNPDGIGSASATNVSSFGGIAGSANSHAGFLAGVFVNASEPFDPPPPSLLFSDAGGGGSIANNFASLSPALNQVFFIGDGLTGNGTGATQQFNVPVGATRLFLGLIDAPSYFGAPGAYGDNIGAFAATFTVTGVPEPASGCLMLTALATAAAARRFRRRGRTSPVAA